MIAVLLVVVFLILVFGVVWFLVGPNSGHKH